MKTFDWFEKIMMLVVVMIVSLLLGLVPCFAENDIPEDKEKPEVSVCPDTKMKDQCMTCHVYPDMSLKEKKPDANRVFPYGPNMSITDDGKTAVILITDIKSNQVEEFFKYVEWHPEITKCIFEVMSPGGSLFEGWRIVGLMDVWKSRGMIIETRVHGCCMSAGFIIFVNGTPKHRFASATAELMWHELYTFAMFKVSRPSDTMDEAIVLRHLQDTASKFLADRSKLSPKEWDAKVHKKEFWCNGEQAIKFGLSDGYPK